MLIVGLCLTPNNMEDSMTSSAETEELSSWDSYFQDFMNYRKGEEEEEEEPSSSSASPTIVSPKKPVVRNSDWLVPSFSRFKKRRSIIDRDLEDTAISPFHSPKEEKGAVASGETEEETDDRLCSVSKDSSSICTELRKKGLCLVPISLLKELPYLKYS